MRLPQELPILILAAVIAAQPLASPLCTCDMQAEHGAMHAADSGDQGNGAHDDDRRLEMPMADQLAHNQMADDQSVQDSADATDSLAMGVVCECGTCAHFVGLIVQSVDLVAMAPVQFQAPMPHYVEPPTSRTFRPPIPV
jgi:hypothetical protein